MIAVRFTRRQALAFLEICDGGAGIYGTPHEEAEAIVRAALAPKSKPKSSLRKKAERRKRTRAAETRAIYAEVAARADGKCEACRENFGAINPPQMDHYLPKGRYRQSARTCWLVHKSCHDAKHAGRPSVEFWHGQFLYHCEKHDYPAEESIVRAKLEAEGLLQAAESVGCP